MEPTASNISTQNTIDGEIAAFVVVVVVVVVFVVDMALTVDKASAAAGRVEFGNKTTEISPLRRQYGPSGRGRIGPGIILFWICLRGLMSIFGWVTPTFFSLKDFFL